MNGIIYCRVSSKEQIDGTSLESQEQACSDFARAKNIQIRKIFIEQGESAKFADRTQLLELIEFCRLNKGAIQALIVWKVDRFARNVADHFSVKATLAKYGVQIMSVTESIEANPEGRLMETILAGFAQFDNDNRAMRTVQGMRRKLEDGIFPWRPPLGYKKPADRQKKKTHVDVPDQPTFGLLQKIWQEFSTGAYSKAEIRRLMTARGIFSRRSGILTAQSVDNIFRNPFYKGVLSSSLTDQEYVGNHVPMVSEATFAKVQLIIAGRNRSIPHRKNRDEFPLRGLVRCSSCAYYLTASFSRGRKKKYGYYHCMNKPCDRRGKSIPLESIHSEFLTFLAELTPKPGMLEKLAQFVMQSAGQRMDVEQKTRTRVRTTLHAIDKQLQELIRMRSQALISDDELKTHRQALLEKKTAVHAAGEDVVDMKTIETQVTDVIRPLSAPVKTWSELATPIRSRFQRRIFPVGFSAGSIRTAELSLLFATLGSLPGDDSNLVLPTTKSSNQILAEIQGFWKDFNVAEDPDERPKKRVRRRKR